MKALDRYILKEIFSPFLFGLGAFTILFFSVETLIGVARMISESDMGFDLVLEYLGCRLPQVLIFTLPMASLMACLLAFGRLSGEAELTAMRASGLSFFRIAFPALLFFLVLSALSFWMNDTIVPAKMKRAYEILFSSQEEELYQKAILTAPKALKNGLEQMLYAHKFNLEEKTMQGVYIHYLWEDRRRREIYAEQARWTGKVWEMKNMRTTEYDSSLNPSSEVTAEKGWTGLSPGESPPSPEDLSKRPLRPEEMTRAELADALIVLASESNNEFAEKRDRYAVVYHQKASLPWVSFIFATFAIPLGVRPHRSSKSMGLGLSLVFILIYYVLMTVGMVLGEAGSLDPMTGAWLPNLVFGMMGLALLITASRS
jgi:lipopolysaccharide export system permease protein